MVNSKLPRLPSNTPASKSFSNTALWASRISLSAMTRACGLIHWLWAMSDATRTISVNVSSKEERALFKSCRSIRFPRSTIISSKSLPMYVKGGVGICSE
ncbi:MAG: hypothetical protein ABSE45_01355 [Candidatus Acidiferrales bacterium]|jgi:hypothetical protein